MQGPASIPNPIDEKIKYVLPEKETRHWGSLQIYPKYAHFQFQNSTERIYILARKHFITNSGWITKAMFMSMLPFLLVIGIKYSSGFMATHLGITAESIGWISPTLIIALVLSYYSFVFTYMWTQYIGWFHNVYLITNQRMIHTNFRLLTGITIVEALLDNIVDITQENYGFFPAMFNYGNVKVQTRSGLKSRFNFVGIPDPSWFRSVIYELAKLLNQSEI
jgi:hypothetical protein